MHLGEVLVAAEVQPAGTCHALEGYSAGVMLVQGGYAAGVSLVRLCLGLCGMQSIMASQVRH